MSKMRTESRKAVDSRSLAVSAILFEIALGLATSGCSPVSNAPAKGSAGVPPLQISPALFPEMVNNVFGAIVALAMIITGIVRIIMRGLNGTLAIGDMVAILAILSGIAIILFLVTHL